MTTNKRNLVLGVAAGLVVLAAVVSGLRRPPSTLLQRARKVATVGAWDVKHDNYFWLSDREALLVMQGTGPGDENGPPLAVGRVGAATGGVTADTALEARLHGYARGGVPGWQLSPDARWLLCHGHARSWAAVRLDGPGLVTRPFQDSASGEVASLTAWLPDSRSWVQAVQEEGMTHHYLYRLDTPRVADHVGRFGLDGLEVIGFYSPTRLLTVMRRTGDGGGISMADYDALSPATSPRFYIQHVPANMDVQQVVLSPDRNRLAWKFTVKPLPLGLKATINSGYVRRSSPVAAGLWVSDLNCNNLREIGTVDIRDDQITDLRWTPDGRRLSFIEGAALYTVPAN